MKILILSPHRDDAALSLALAVEHWLAEGHVVDVVNCFTQSEYAPLAPQAVRDSLEIRTIVSAMRAKEDQAWLCSYANARHLSIVDFNFEDAPIRLNCTADEVCTRIPKDGSTEKSLSVEITRLVANKNIDAIVLPMALGNHIDHLTARNAILSSDVCKDIPCAFYEDLPYASRPGADREITDVAQSFALNLEEAFVSETTDGSGAMERKLQSAMFYSSQIESSVAEDIAQFCIRYGGRERIWVNPLWRNSPLMYNEKSPS